ncbi:MAG TPA: hypothetical protein VHL78_06265 [Actinomycetota bacterium]|nr:hypothetical protein [Actinomycetota bacterium]
MSAQASPEDVREAEDELDRVRAEWLRRAGVTGVDVGFKRAGPPGELAIRVYVERKLPPEAVPEHDRFPERLGRFPVDVVEATFGPE